MIRGTTPSFTWALPFDTSLIVNAEVLIKYIDANKAVVIEKPLSSCSLKGNSISATLTMEETLRLPAPSNVKVQLRVKLNDNTVLATSPKEVPVEELLKEGVI